ncbi:hypothetical protein [Thermomonospora echinospora]|uniref:hypothetical protein n=1 Tax=Thermomonospora echinospora TaxID=1992 RepID=UPI000CDF0074|nr:hypothetical protein [Thermomonospora echinospora]
MAVWFGLTSGQWRARVSVAGGRRLLEATRSEDLRMQIRGALEFWPTHAAQHQHRIHQRPTRL